MNARPSIRMTGICVAMLLLCLANPLYADAPQDVQKELEQLREQNRLMQQQLEKQQQMIDQLNLKLNDLKRPSDTAATPPPGGSGEVRGDDAPVQNPGGLGLGKAILSGEGGVGFFASGKNGDYPNAEFLVDEARLFLDAPLWENVYFFGELDLITREAIDDNVHMGELYVDFEDIAPIGGQEHLLNARAGRMYIPFGEEYQVRTAIDNPLISHSLSDIWGMDQGLEIYGSANKFSYVIAVQSGGISVTDDNTADKAVTGRLSYDPASWLHLSASAMRTGDLSVSQDFVSAVWFGNGLFQSIGSKKTTLFHADLAEADAQFKWHRGSLKTAAGYADYNDNDPAADNHRDFYYYYAELTQGITEKLYAAARLSQIDVPEGYPLVAESGSYSGIPTKDLWTLSLGLGYRFNPHLLLKSEYRIEHGEQTDGSPRNHENLFAVEAAFKF